MKEATGFEAKTIHRLLEVDPSVPGTLFCSSARRLRSDEGARISLCLRSGARCAALDAKSGVRFDVS
jgi:hypothetical protein